MSLLHKEGGEKGEGGEASQCCVCVSRRERERIKEIFLRVSMLKRVWNYERVVMPIVWSLARERPQGSRLSYCKGSLSTRELESDTLLLSS